MCPNGSSILNTYVRDIEDFNLQYSEQLVKHIKDTASSMNETQILGLLKYLLLRIEQNKTENNHYYWWLTFGHCLNHLNSGFYNDNIDITALILLKCYEFLILKVETHNNSLKNLQENFENIVNSVVNKISKQKHQQLVAEIFSNDLPCSSEHQYDSASLDHYILKRIDSSSSR